MSRPITVAAAQTGPVETDDIRPGIEEACRMVEEAATKQVDIIGFSELFLSPFFPNRLEKDFSKWFLELTDERIQPLLTAAKQHHMALVFPFGERCGRHFYN